MLSYFTTKTPTSKNSASENQPFVDERLVHMQAYQEVNDRLNVAKDQIQDLEAKLAEKEKSLETLHQNVHTLTTAVAQEKSNAQENKAQFNQEEDNLATQIASLRAALSVKEDLYEKLRKKILELQAQQQEQLALQDRYKLLQAKMDEKEREYASLVSKMSELESAKQKIEQILTQEQIEHKETKSALESEKEAQRAQKIPAKDAQPAQPPQTSQPPPFPYLTNHSSNLFKGKPTLGGYHHTPAFSSEWEAYMGL